MNLAEYASYDGLGLAELVAKKQVSPKELANTAVAAMEKIDGKIRSIVELYPDRIEKLDETSLGAGPFRGVPFLIKDVFGHEQGRKIVLGDVAEVWQGAKDRGVIARYNGRESVELAIYKEGDANTVAVANTVRDRLQPPVPPAGMLPGAAAPGLQPAVASVVPAGVSHATKAWPDS